MFRSFYLAGFECSTGYNMHGEWIDQVAATQHDRHVDEDYERLAEVELHAVREAIRWPLVDRHGRHDFTSVNSFIRAAVHHHIDVIWDLFHYGYPGDLDPFSPRFVERFEAYCEAAARHVCARMPGPHFFAPINEPSYFSWAAGEAGRFAPHQRGRGFELKVQLARAALRGIAAIRSVCPSARIVNVDPICRVVPRSDSPEELEQVRHFNEQAVFETWDMLCGRMLPELGGRPDCLDIVGLNYYWTNQWELGKGEVPLADDDPRRVPLGELVKQAWERYGAEIVITETSALGDARAPWVHELSAMAQSLLESGVKLRGICLYPILGMPEWHARSQWTRMGLWDIQHDQALLERKIHTPMFHALRSAQRRELARGGQRSFTLARTGSAPLVVQGKLVAHAANVDHGYDLLLIRSDVPARLWVASIAIHADSRFVRHVSTAAELPLLVEMLRSTTPAAIARQHGVSAPMAAADEATTSWLRELERLLEGTGNRLKE